MISRIAIFFIIIFFPLFSYAEKSKSGDWVLDLDNTSGLTQAFTANQSGSTFGFICSISSNGCFYYFSPQATCEAGAAGGILINLDAGALSATTECAILGSSYYSLIKETKDIHLAIIGSNNIGIAIPMKDGQFKVVRFSLRGAEAAIRAAAEHASNFAKKTDELL
jgi:hypothetical protein